MTNQKLRELASRMRGAVESHGYPWGTLVRTWADEVDKIADLNAVEPSEHRPKDRPTDKSPEPSVTLNTEDSQVFADEMIRAGSESSDRDTTPEHLMRQGYRSGKIGDK